MIVSIVRTSTNKQDESIKSQINMIQKYCDLKEIHLDQHFVDEGVSGGSLKHRDQFNDLMELVKDNKIDTIICVSLSRISRNTLDLLKFVQTLQDTDTNLVVLKENIDLKTPMGKFFVSILGSIYDLERNLISERTKDILNNKKDHNKVYCGNTPYGYDRNGDRLVENPTEIRMIKKVHTLRNQDKSYGEIVKFLKRNKYTTKKGDFFGKNNVKSLLNTTKNHPCLSL